MTYRLIGMPLSVATQRALWALDYAEVAYQFEEYLPQISTPWLRLRTRRWRGPISVPVLLGEGGLCLLDSWDIALQVNQDQPLAGLIPTLCLDQVQAMNQLSESIFNAARMLMVNRALQDKDALLEAFPDLFPRWSRRPMLPVMRRTFGMLLKKYGEPGVSLAEYQQRLDGFMLRVREQLDGKPYLLDRGFCYADMTVVAAMAMVKPVPRAGSPAPTAYERANTCDGIVTRYEDVLDWRDGVVARHRRRTYLGNPV
ncbi:MAG: hypothetical protein CMK83_02570 [Pseudomonadales bacterium]|nr:hypothetical protein [Pseudomonadales bacterium]MEC8812741.1 glutathione S-transferase N-terminal domain-containing protein [Pseudomonadota bacterium]HAG94257.1 hypothetical protein [Gammaproteobacteria bacterium]MAQ23081.1 hypothetical protein [Pseudomonadales bacterium]MBI27832.1 hypothetical protein [Pseudomonadales bacterium]